MNFYCEEFGPESRETVQTILAEVEQFAKMFIFSKCHVQMILKGFEALVEELIQIAEESDTWAPQSWSDLRLCSSGSIGRSPLDSLP